MADFLYLDLETIPTQRDDFRARIAEKVCAPGNIKKPESIAAWEAEQKPGAVLEAVAKTSFDGAYGHICCIGYAIDDQEPQALRIEGDVSAEKDMLAEFAARVSHKNEMVWAPTVVGHNVASFDLRFLWQRAIVLGVRLPGWMPRDAKPWGNEVFDTMTKFAGAQGKISLDNLALALGLQGKSEIDGSMVASMWAEGRYDEISRYCLDDVRLTREIHKRMREAGL